MILKHITIGWNKLFAGDFKCVNFVHTKTEKNLLTEVQHIEYTRDNHNFHVVMKHLHKHTHTVQISPLCVTSVLCSSRLV